MPTVAEHYERVLSPVYAWMTGGAEAAIAAGQAEIAALDLHLAPGARVVDLGAGFGMHAIPLARAGARVLAIDSSAHLLAELKRLAGDLPITTVQDDLLSFRAHLEEKAAAIFCMGDTLTHLPEHTNVDFLVQEAAESLPSGGLFVLSFRDYTEPLLDDQRFIPVRSDERRILTCFLEYEEDTVVVHDILHERAGDAWETRVSSYRKLRLSPERVTGSLESFGFDSRREEGLRGMVRIVARLR
ncbi:MAG TPA: class I SAM-dependent methyltransferase [Steroidobacteraceae bacterium]|jgi:SAM-dependent methyltransferase|nr:class I SAM-dependent methyltransferase [Steroidobacteraceae bacterium]